MSCVPDQDFAGTIFSPNQRPLQFHFPGGISEPALPQTTRILAKINPFSAAGGRLYTSESDVCRRQFRTYKDGSRTERIKIFTMAVDPYHRYIQMKRNKLTRTFMIISNSKNPLVSMVYTKLFRCCKG